MSELKKYAHLKMTKLEEETFIERCAIANEEEALKQIIRERVERDKKNLPNLLVVGVAGSRTFKDKAFLFEELDKYKIVHLVSGGSADTDLMVLEYANKRDITISTMKPDFDVDGKSAVFKRNARFVNSCDELVVFWDGVSGGTGNIIDKANYFKANINVIKFKAVTNGV